MTRQRGGATVPSRIVHTDVAFAVLAITGLAALAVGLRVLLSEPVQADAQLLAALAVSSGFVAGLTGCICAPIIIAIARRDRAALALVRTRRSRSLALPGAVSNRVLLRSLRALNPSAPTPRSVVWAVDERGMELWQPQSSSPTLTVPWTTVAGTSTGEMLKVAR